MCIRDRLYSCSWGKCGVIWCVWHVSQSLYLLLWLFLNHLLYLWKVTASHNRTVNLGSLVSAFLCSKSHSLGAHQQTHYWISTNSDPPHCLIFTDLSIHQLFPEPVHFCFLITLSIQYIFNILLQQQFSSAVVVSFSFPYCLGFTCSFYNSMLQTYNLRNFFLI